MRGTIGSMSPWACRGCGAYLIGEDEIARCEIDSCPLCRACWEEYGYAPQHSEAEINRTSLLGPHTKRWPVDKRPAN